jgi:hypothetical protein
MKPRRAPDSALQKPVCTWLSIKDHLSLTELAKSNKVTVASYLRAIIVDVIAEEHASLRVASASTCKQG